jgi:hypothetical protein
MECAGLAKRLQEESGRGESIFMGDKIEDVSY